MVKFLVLKETGDSLTVCQLLDIILVPCTWGHVVAQLVEALSYKPGSIPAGVNEIFHPSGRTMTLISTQPLTEISSRNISLEGGVGADGARG